MRLLQSRSFPFPFLLLRLSLSPPSLAATHSHPPPLLPCHRPPPISILSGNFSTSTTATNLTKRKMSEKEDTVPSMSNEESEPRSSDKEQENGGGNEVVDSHGDGDDVIEFRLSPSSECSLKILKGDITRWFVDGSSDAIVNAANERMLGGGGVDGAIHRAAGPELKEACYRVPEVRPGVRCPTGEARITPGFKLPVSHVIHTVGPIYDVDENPEASLKNAFSNSLRVAKENNIQYVAFPAISCGVYGYPYDEAASIAVSTVKEFANDFKEVHFVLFSDELYETWLKKAREIVGH